VVRAAAAGLSDEAVLEVVAECAFASLVSSRGLSQLLCALRVVSVIRTL
jgi:hypothetical protein